MLFNKYRNHRNNKELHPRALKLIELHTHKFEDLLRSQAQILASKSKADVVMSSHVIDALDKIESNNKQNWAKEIGMVVGSAMFGIFLQEFISELYTGNILLIAGYTFIGFMGMIVVFWAIQK